MILPSNNNETIFELPDGGVLIRLARRLDAKAVSSRSLDESPSQHALGSPSLLTPASA